MEVDQSRQSVGADSAIHREGRMAVEQTRRRQTDTAHLVATFDRGETVFAESPAGPIELAIQATNPDGELAPWLDDIWWTDAITRWGSDCVTVRVAPTPDSLLHPVLLYQLQMLRRVVPAWRIVGHAYADDVSTEDQIKQLAVAPYHEVRFVDQQRPGGRSPELDAPRPLSELFAALRAEQRRLGVTLPVLSRLAG